MSRSKSLSGNAVARPPLVIRIQAGVREEGKGRASLSWTAPAGLGAAPRCSATGGGGLGVDDARGWQGLEQRDRGRRPERGCDRDLTYT